MTFSNDPVLDISGASVGQSGQTILENVTFSIDKGEFVYLIGRTGSGKSTLLRTLYAELPPHGGTLNAVGYDLSNLKRKEVPRLRRKLGIVFQDFQLFEDRSVAENLIFVMKATGWSDKSKMKGRVAEVLMNVGLPNSGQKMPHQLSGGEQQRVGIARALINFPNILIADEPTGNLDPYFSEEIYEVFKDINNKGTAVLMATHDHHIIKRHPARVLQCEDGRLLDSVKEKVTYGLD
ncbi:phosphonate ABC transporter ATP-binding protein [Fulvitalea axinellae]|uniref:Cell division ATP-binding protein FtsE n=1 Tax=Fulvitalea axinellae TaxID=1182444 RepID=A0AAU9CV69_9BACT|nr:phosphonate ABC transporter ATP-binding protein [Fulvitalea axinellae]